MSTTVREVISKFEEKYNAAGVTSQNGNFHFLLSGDDGGEYTIKVIDGICTIEEGVNGNADCVVSTKAKTFLSIVDGKTNPMFAVLTGRLKVSNMSVLMDFAKPFGLMK